MWGELSWGELSLGRVVCNSKNSRLSPFSAFVGTPRVDKDVTNHQSIETKTLHS